MKLTVFFDDPYWVGVVEVADGNQLRAYRHVFGAEPDDQEVLAFVQADMLLGLRNVKPITAEQRVLEVKNPKRLQRQATRELQQRGISTKAQAALQADLEARKQERRVVSRAEREAVADYKRQLARAKAKAKHRGH